MINSRKKRKASRRSKENKKKGNVNIKLIHSNIDGYTSKKESVNEIVEIEKPDIMTLNDTNLKGKLKVKVPNYFSYDKNREKYKGGVSTIIANHLKHNTMKVTEGKEEDEYIVTRFDNTMPPINIFNVYGQQESRTSDAEIEKSWLRLMKDVKDVEDRYEAVLIIGDMNRKVGSDEYGVKGNNTKTTFGGNLIRNLIKEGQYILINNLDIVKGGPWTWVDRQNPNRKSCLDLGIMSTSLLPYLTKVEIDIDKKITPRRVMKKKGKITTIHSDHFSVLVEFKEIPRKHGNEQPKPVWNLGKPDGWKVYESETNKIADKIQTIVEEEGDINTVMKKLEAMETKIKFKAFGKTKQSVKTNIKVKNCGPPCSKSSCKKCNNCKTQIQKDEETHERQAHKIEAAIQKIKDSKQGRVGNVFMIKKVIAGPKKTPQEAAAIKDPKTGQLIVCKEDIKRATLEYCTKNLENNQPDIEVKEAVIRRKIDQVIKMSDKSGEEFDVTLQDYEQVLAKFAKKETKTYDYILNAGEKYKLVIYKLCKRIIENEEIPECFRITTLYMVWKRKGSADILKNNRFLHMKQVLARTVDSMVVQQMKQTLISKLSIYQVGGLPGHSINEHLLTIKTVLARLEEIGKGLIFLVMDIISFFDKEDIYDCLETMEALEVNKKATRMWYLLNKNTKIRVKTAFGLTNEAEVGDCLGQGTGGAGLVSAANLDLGLQRSFNNSKAVMNYGQVRLQPLSYQDDVATLCTSVEMARDQANRLSEMIKKKTIDAHPDKSGILVLGSTSFKDKIKRDLEDNPINFNKFKLKLKPQDKYLGQIIDSNLNNCALATVRDRAGKIKGAAMEVKQIIEDFEMQAVGGLAAAWELWERALIPSLMSGAGTWLGDVKETVKLCNNIQGFYWRTILKIPDSCPKLALRCETFSRDIKWRIWEEKCLLLLRIKDLEDGSLAKMIYQEAEDNGWPGLGREVRLICKDIKIPDLNIHRMMKKEVQKAIEVSHYEDMMSQFDSSRKLQDIKDSDFSCLQPYFNDTNLEKSRTKFKLRTKMLENIPGNFKNKYKNIENGLICNLCPEEMTQNHCVICPGRKEERKNLDLNSLDDLVSYFRIILEK